LVLLFPASGGLAVLVALAAGLTGHRAWSVVLVVIGAVPLVALLVGLRQLPPGSTFEAGLWTIGLGAAGVCLGGLLEALSGRGRDAWARSSGSD
jgi:hypothetical protein